MKRTLFAASLALSFLALPALAQDKTAPAKPAAPSKPIPIKPAQPSKGIPTKPGAPDKKAGALLAAVAKRVGALHALSYTATATTPGNDKAPKYTAQVVAARADAGGWKLSVKGSTAAEGKSHDFEIAFDGVTARSIRPDEKTVVERSFKDAAELPTFLSTQQARPVVLWELLADKPFADEARRASFEGVRQLNGEQVDVVSIAPVPPAADAPEEPSPVAGLRLFIGKDLLPRRVEHLVKPAEDGTQTPSRLVVLSDVQTDANVPRVAFSIPIPDGYRVRVQAPQSAKKSRPANDDRPAGPAAAGNGLLAVGSAAPEWSLKDPDGKTHKLSDYKGKVVLMDFWATWCPPCKAAMPGVQKLHEKYNNKGVKVFGLSTWERGDAPAYMRDHRFTYGLLLKADAVSSTYKVTGIPTFYVVGPDGKILWNAVGYSPAHEKEISDAIDKALNQPT